jgi:hypothetical protein
LPPLRLGHAAEVRGQLRSRISTDERVCRRQGSAIQGSEKNYRAAGWPDGGNAAVVAGRGEQADLPTIIADQQSEKIKDQTSWYTQMLEYRLACSLESVYDKTGRPISVVPELQEMPFTSDKDKPLETQLTALLDFVNTKVVAQEVTKRLVGTHLRHFQRLLEALEAMALEPSFWNGIE